MNYKQYLLNKLAEEASEISQAAIKCALFGYQSKDPRELDLGKTNIEKLLYELADLQAVIELLSETEEFEDTELLESIEPEQYIAGKRIKLMYYWNMHQQIKGD